MKKNISKSDPVMLWKQRNAAVAEPGPPNTAPQPQSSGVTLGRVKLQPKKKSGKLSVDKLLLKAVQHVEQASIPTSTFVPEDKLKARDKPLTDKTTDNISTGSLGDISISSRSINSHGLSLGSGGISKITYAINSQRANGEPYRCEKTIREMISDIEYHARLNKPAPVYVPKMHELSPDSLAWDGMTSRRSARSRNGSFTDKPEKVQVNVIGCLKSLELVLATADQRTRKMKEKVEMKAKVCEDQRKLIDAIIQQKHTRAEQHAHLIARRQQQIQWMRILKICGCISRLKPLYMVKAAAMKTKEKSLSAGEIIFRAVCFWYRRLKYQKYKLFVIKALFKHRLRIEIGLRVYRKRKAVKRIKNMLTACHGYQKLQMKVVVSNFLRSVRGIQKQIRLFLLCKKARVVCLSVLWDRIEVPYIKKKLKKREELRDNVVNTKELELTSICISEQSRIEMKAQAKKWGQIDSKIAESLQKHRFQGNLKQETSEDVINKMLAPMEIKQQILGGILEARRKEYNLRREEFKRSLMANISLFSQEDAFNLLHGSGDVMIDRIVNKKAAITVKSRSEDPFLLYTTISHQLIFHQIKKAHEELGTFVIKIDQNTKYAKRYAKIRQQLDHTEHLDVGPVPTKVSRNGSANSDDER